MYARSGDFVVVGTSNGSILVLDGNTLTENVRFKQAKTAIRSIAVSSSGRHIAAASADGYVLLIFLVPYKQTLRWEYIGRNKVHYSPVVAVHFGEAPSGETRCFSLSSDGRMAEFDLEASSLEAGVVVCGTSTTGVSAAPTAMSFTPPLTYFEKGVIDTQLIIADDGYKVRVFNPDTAVTSATYRGPVGASPIAQMTMFQTSSCAGAFVAFRYVIHGRLLAALLQLLAVRDRCVCAVPRIRRQGSCSGQQTATLPAWPLCKRTPGLWLASLSPTTVASSSRPAPLDT